MPINTTDLATAGLPQEGIYRVEVQDGEKRVGQTSGVAYCNLHFTMNETPEGSIERPPHVWENFFPNSSGGAERVKSLCLAMLGEVPQGERNPETGTMELDEEDLVDALIAGKAWTVYFWKREEDGSITGNLGWKFADDPGKLRAPKPLTERERDNA
jgi:hypothetical protein